MPVALHINASASVRSGLDFSEGGAGQYPCTLGQYPSPRECLLSLLFMGVSLFLFFWPHCAACGISVANQGSNL